MIKMSDSLNLGQKIPGIIKKLLFPYHLAFYITYMQAVVLFLHMLKKN